MALTASALTVDGEQMQGTVALLSTLGKLWLAGVTIDWSLLYHNESRQRIPLPTYPFERQSYWIESPEVLERQQRRKQIDITKRTAIADWFYVPTWEQAPLPPIRDHLLPSQQIWLIFTDELGFSDQLSRKLNDNAQTVVRVYAGTQFAHLDEDSYILSPSDLSSYSKLIQHLAAKGQQPSRVVHAWNLREATNEATSLSEIDFNQTQSSSFYSLLYLVQALSSQFIQHAIHIDVLTSCLQKVRSQDPLRPALATILGACKVIPQESLNITCRSIDLNLYECNSYQKASFVDLIFNELTDSSLEPVVAYRDTTRWLQHYLPIHLTAPETIPSYLRHRGSYLITGGLGHIGLLLAEYLAHTVQARLILIGRTGLPPRQTWSSWLESHPTDESISQKIRRIQQLEATGTEVLIFKVDVAEVEQVEAVFGQVERLFGPIHGVIHAAGITSESSFKNTQEISYDDCELHFQPKVYGLLALEQVLRPRTLDFCLVFSSLSSILGGLGLFAYAAASAFMDAFVQHINQQTGTPWLTVNWDTWQAQTNQDSSSGSTVAGSYAMTAEQGCQAVARVLSTHNIPHLINSTGNLTTRICQWVLLEGLRQEPGKTEAQSVQIQPTPGRRLSRSEYEQVLTSVWQEILGLPQVGLYENFFDLGGNSLNGLQAVARIRKLLQIQLPVVALFEAPTISAMADYLYSTLSPLPEETAPEDRFQQRRQQARTRQGASEIAVIAMTGRFPGASSVEQFWQNLQEGVESITFFSEEELLHAGVDPAVLRDPQYVKARPILPPELVEQFDASFFGYSPREAELLDPQHRLFLECSWEVLERAGYAPENYEGRIGVFGGANISTYLHTILQQPDLVASLQEIISGYQIAISMDKDSLTTAVSYKLHLTGPSLAVQTFCSTSLVAVHLACQSLLNGECDMSLAGGVSVGVPVQRGYHYEPGGMESPDGHCRTFDAQARGSMFGDGVGVVVLKRLADAQEDGDQILAVLKGSAINNDGSLKVSYTAPSVVGQTQVVQDALANAGVSPESISYVEAHGTATELGDPIELASLTRAYRKETDRRQYCAIGSVKTNVGHLDRAAGISGLIKTILALQHEQIPASLHYQAPNPEIDFEQSPFYVNTHLCEWPRGAQPRRAGVNSLGMGGTNVHVIVEEAPLQEVSSGSRPWQILQLSARTKTALQEASQRLGTYLQAYPESKLADVAYTLQVGRTAFAHRQVLVCRDVSEAATALLKNDPHRLLTSQQEQRDRPVAFLFSGISEQFIGEGLELYLQEPTFKTWVDHCCDLLKPHIDCDLREILFRVELSTSQNAAHRQTDLWTLIQDKAYRETALRTVSERLNRPALIHAALFILDYALAQLLLQWGVRPQFLSGYGPGEYVAFCIAGILSLDDALKLTIRKAERLQDQTVDTAPSSTPSEHDALITCNISLYPPTIPCMSAATGTWITDEQAVDPSYWAQQISQPVHFAKGIEHILQQEDLLLLEVGSGQSFATYLQQYPACTVEHRQLIISTLPTDHEPAQAILLTLGKLWLHGVKLNWSGFYAREQRQRVLLPTYPFERQRYWLADFRPAASIPATSALIERKPAIDDWFYQSNWRQVPLQEVRRPSTSRAPWLVLTDTGGLGVHLVAQLTQLGLPVISVQAARQYTQLDAHTFRIRPQEPTDYRLLCDTLVQQDALPCRVLHCWSVTNQELSFGPTTFSAVQEQSFFSLLWLTQALSAHTYDQPLTIFVFSTHAQAVLPADVIQPEKAPILGACKVIPQEPLNIACCSIDLDMPVDHNWSGLAATLIAECLHPTTNVVAYRQGKRWIQEYTAVSLPPSSPERLPFRQHGIYLITGGLGGIGLVLAEYLAHTFEARLILLGRSGLPPRQQWSEWVQTHPADDPLSLKIVRLQAMEKQGAQILIYQANVADAEQLHSIIQETRSIFGTLHGVFHAAGITDDSNAFKLVQEIDQAACEMHFQSKVYGTYALAQAVENIELDFCLLFSSLSAVLGGLGFVAYTASNIFLDAFAQRYNQYAKTPWFTVNWDTWLVKQNAHGMLGATIAAFAMQPSEAIEAMLRALISGHTHLVNSTGDLHTRLKQWICLDLLQEMEQSTPRAASVPSSDDYEHTIRMVWQDVLGVQDVGIYENFFDLGGNSLIAIQLISKLKKAFRRPIPAVALFEAPTISALTHYLRPEPKPVQVTDTLAERRARVRQTVGNQEIALVGMSGRFPGASTVEQFWQNLQAGVESISFFTPEELEAAGVDLTHIQAPNYVPARPILSPELVQGFDAAFFGYSPREAELTDPQHRLFLECAWEALEQAGYDSQTYNGLISVFGGTNISTYILSADPALVQATNSHLLLAGNDKDSLTSSVSYKLNLRGPSLTVQTFCSTSLVAVHLACQSLLNGECDLALAGGASILVPSIQGHLYEPGGMESPDGHCHTFDAEARGSMFGDGVGVVALKRLSDALSDGDNILAVIKGSAVNNDGSLKVSYAAPSVVGQAAVVQTALANAGVSAESISYVEAHGTATELGDPIEMASLTRAYRTQTDRVNYCAIGSVKTNVGHLDRAAGVSGLIKTVLALRNEQIPASLHYQSPNPEIDFERSPFFVNTYLRPWPRTATPRRAGINSLGMGGTNAHVIVEEASLREPSGPSRSWQLLVLSARTETALEQIKQRLRETLEQEPQYNLADVAYTLQVGRRRFERRSVLLCRNREEAQDLLTGPLPLLTENRTDRPVAFLFAGVGEHYVGMTQELYQQEPFFRETLDRCCTILQRVMNRDIREVLFPEKTVPARLTTKSAEMHAVLGRNGRSYAHNNGHNGSHASTSRELLAQTALVQPVLFVVEYALAQLLMHWGLYPQVMSGYSLGEYVAACLAGVLSLEDALTLVARRAQLIQAQPAGSMLTVALSEQEVRLYLNPQVSLAVINGPHTCVLAGPQAALNEIAGRLDQRGIAYRHVETTHAFHSTMLEPLQKQVAELTRTFKLHPPKIPYISNVTGTWITAEQATDPNYWAQHMCQTVRFADGIAQVLQTTESVLLEIGPGSSLSSFVKQHPACDVERRALVLPTLPAGREQQSEMVFLLTLLGKLWQTGVTINWHNYYADERRQRVSLPTYPFERQRYWLESIKTPATDPITARMEQEATARLDMEHWFYHPSWKRSAPYLPIGRALKQPAQCWLLFLDTSDVGKRLAIHLVQLGHTVITVQAGTSFARLGPDNYTISQNAREDYVLLLKELRKQGQSPQQIIHLWTVGLPAASYEQTEPLETFLECGFYSLISLTQALGNLGMDNCQLSIISSDMQDVTAHERICPAKATILGPCKVIPQEHPQMRCRSIDISYSHEKGFSDICDRLLGELLANTSDTVVALRGSHRWLQSFEPFELADQNMQDDSFRPNGVYLITGGLGGIGLAMAAYLAKKVQARLILTGRSPFPHRQDWPALLTQVDAATSTVGRQIRQIKELEQWGAEVIIAQADVNNEAQMQAVIQQTLATFGTLHGVLHVAGMPGSGLIQLKTPEDTEKVFASKVRGTQTLARVLQHIPLDFLVLFSSICSATGGGPGQVDYCAANAFLDAYAHNQSSHNYPTISINWSEWQWNAWDDGLSGFPLEAQQYFRLRRHKFGISFEEGAEALSRILQRRLTQVVVSTEDFQLMLENSQRSSTATLLQDVADFRQAQMKTTTYPRPILGTEYVAPESEMEQEIAEIWSTLLGVEQIGIHDNFFELGGHSLMGTQLIVRLRQTFQVDVRLVTIFEAPTIAELAVAIEMMVIEEIEQLNDEVQEHVYER